MHGFNPKIYSSNHKLAIRVLRRKNSTRLGNRIVLPGHVGLIAPQAYMHVMCKSQPIQCRLLYSMCMYVCMSICISAYSYDEWMYV
jgi:hypothetical protein